MNLDWWNLPGPSAWLDGLLESLRAGRNLIVRLPDHSPPGLRDALQQRVSSGGGWSWTPIWLDSAMTTAADPASFVWQRFCGDKVSGMIDAVTLARSDHLQDHVVWLEGFTDELWQEWYEFLTIYADTSRERDPCDRGLFVVCCDGALGEKLIDSDVALSVHTLHGTADSLDMSLWIASFLQGRNLGPMEIRLRTAVAVELAGSDVDLAQVLASLELDSLFDPWECLVTFGYDRGWDSGDEKSLSWHSGMIQLLDGQQRTHSALIAVNGEEGTANIRQRIWKGQVAVLFPFLEQERVALLNHLKPLLRTPFRTKFGEVSDIFELELGHILAQVGRRVKPGLRRKLENLVSMRNALAHLEPVTGQQVRIAMAASH